MCTREMTLGELLFMIFRTSIERLQVNQKQMNIKKKLPKSDFVGISKAETTVHN